jgi:hypothetical protein
LFFFGLFSASGEEGDVWTVKPFSNPLSGRTVTVTRRLWAEGPLTPGEPEGPMRPDTVFALYCLREEMRSRGMCLPETADSVFAYAADFFLSETEAEQWLTENCWRFGFVMRDETDENGTRIHLRFVGPVHAAAMRALDVDLEAYLHFLRETGQAALLRNGQTAAWIICVPEQEALAFVLPEDGAWEISGDGAGWVNAAALSGS